MKLIILFFSLLNFSAYAEMLEIQALSCSAYNVLGMSQFTLDTKTQTLHARTTHALGITENVFHLKQTDPLQTFGEGNVPFSTLQFQNTDKADSENYVLVFSSLFNRKQSHYQGVWGTSQKAGVFVSYKALIPIAFVNCEINF